VHRVFRSRGLAIVAVSLVALAGGALLAWWQWTRYESASGTLQNLGYVLQWPLFGVFPGFMFWKIHRTARRERELAQAEDRADTTPTATNGVAEAVPVPRPAQPAAEPAPIDLAKMTYTQNRTVSYQVDEDVDLLAYNQRLAQLADREQRHAR
jgi:DNA-binding transcriptional regulator of glucitol operon